MLSKAVANLFLERKLTARHTSRFLFGLLIKFRYFPSISSTFPLLHFYIPVFFHDITKNIFDVRFRDSFSPQFKEISSLIKKEVMIQMQSIHNNQYLTSNLNPFLRIKIILRFSFRANNYLLIVFISPCSPPTIRTICSNVMKATFH